MTRINAFRSIAETRSSVAWGKHASALIFAAVLIVSSVTVGCSSDKPKPISTNQQIPVTQLPSQFSSAPAPALPAENKPAPKKVVHKKPATINYADKTYGVSFEYPRRYAIETGDAATELLASNPIAMNFIQPGGVALAAVELPETGFANTDFSSAFFNVSVHKTLTADQCSEFAVPQPKIAMRVPSTDSASTASATPATVPVSTPETTTPSPDSQPASNSKLMVGDLELRSTEAVSGEGTRQSDSKYFHLFQNGACYEFALNLTTVASEDGVMKHVDRDKVFGRLEQILATVKINPIAAPEVTAEAPAPTPAPVTPAQ
ncbi:MAG TPA: hypothetical protein VIH75_04020 [Candidatus Sulfotelmatobacter sp.]